MLDKKLSNEELQELMGKEKFVVWKEVCSLIEILYNMEVFWNSGGKKWKYEYKYRRGGKTLCALYAKEDCFGFMVIFGKDERAKFENEKSSYSAVIQKLYDDATTYHDGKWIMIELADTLLMDEIKRLLIIKRKPNRK